VRLDFKRSLVFRAAHYAAYLAGVARELLREPNRLALVVTNPPFLPVWAALIRTLIGGRFAVEIQDLYPDGLLAVGILREGMAAEIWRRLNRAAFRRAESVIVLGRDMAARLESTYGVASEKIRVIPHWSPVEEGFVADARETRLLGELKLGGKFVVQYSGNMGLWHDIEQIVRAAEILRRSDGIHFLMVGGGRRRAAAEKLAKSLGLGNMTWTDFRPKEDLADSLSACHVALISQRAGVEGVAVPCKLYGILASGRPVIAAVPETSETARVVREEACGAVVVPEDADALASAIRHLAGNPPQAAEMGFRARRAYETNYSLDSALDAFERCALGKSN
jgi:glycosyltransferase involved in cell wall biosynthesis